ncbi:MAG: AGE family epimerase/isomerase, partial [Oscillospiraceae bacterium]|nr:AGE family epimerase/isomerase [Oscillospiraceae bacterium]
MGDLKTFKAEITLELYRIMSFWNNLKDEENGGFYGYVNQDLEIDKNAEKGAILHSRIMWFYSNVYLVLKEKSTLLYAKHAYEFFKNHLLDRECGGVYWMVDFKGNPTDDMKHTYNQAFAIYALSSYDLASGEKEALELAYKIFNLIEMKCTDKYGYMEAFDRNWKEIENDKLSEDGYM